MNILDYLEKEWFLQETKKEFSNLFEFNNSQLYSWLYEWDKKWLKHLIKQEKKIEKLSKNFLGKQTSKPSGYTLDCYYVNFQYIVELLNRYPKQLWLNKKLLVYNNNGWDDMYVSLRLSLMWHHRTSFFHLRSFIENYFELVWWYTEKNNYLSQSKLIKLWLINKKTWEISEKITPRMKYFSYSWSEEISWKRVNYHDISCDYYFHWEELAKVYNYLSKITHLEWLSNFSQWDNLEYNEKYLDLYYRLWGLVMLLVSRMLYGFMSHNIEKVWMNEVEKPIPWSPSYYRRIIWEMMGDNGLFYDLYEDKLGRKLFLNKNWVWLDIYRHCYDSEERINHLKTLDKLRKKSWWDRELYKKLIRENMEKEFIK